MLRKAYWTIGIAVLLTALAANAMPPSNCGKQNSAEQTATIDNTTFIDANKILMFVTNHGNFGRDLNDFFGNDFGTWFPYSGSLDDIYHGGLGYKSPLYSAGIWLGGKVNGETRVAISEYTDEYVPGPMQSGTFMPDDPAFKVYKIFSDSIGGNATDDYLNWPVSQGAPAYLSGYPRIIGDQTLWAVFNDADTGKHTNDAGGTLPLGIEIQQIARPAGNPGFEDLIERLELEVNRNGSSGIIVKAYAVDYDVNIGDQYMVDIGYDDSIGPVWSLKNLTTDEMLLENQTDFEGNLSEVVEGLQVSVDGVPEVRGECDYQSAMPHNFSPIALEENPSYNGGVWFNGGNHGSNICGGGVFVEPDFYGGTTMTFGEMKPVEIRFRPMESYTDLNSDGEYTIGEPYVVDNPALTQGAFMYGMVLMPDRYLGFFDVPFTAWDVTDPLHPRQLNVVVRDRDENHQWDLHYLADTPDYNLPNDGDMRFNYVWILNTDYDPSGTYYGDGTGGSLDFWNIAGGDSLLDAMWTLWLDEETGCNMLAEEGILTLTPANSGLDHVTDTLTFISDRPNPNASGDGGQAVYITYKLYNKGGNNIEDMYIALWADPDLGAGGDDLVGCDTLDNIFFCYNDGNHDSQYGDSPPASGFKIVYGPLVPSPGDVGYFDGNPVADYKNLDMTAFVKNIYGTDPENPAQIYNYMQGLMADGFPYDWGGTITKFMHSGDPLTMAGDVDFASADRRMMASMGPINMTPGDSQYVLIKFGVGQGTNQLTSITELKAILNEVYDYPVDVADEQNEVVPAEFMLGQNYPNPFNSSTRINYSLTRKSMVSIGVYNILGRKVTELVNETQPAGNHSVIWNGKDHREKDVSSGIYLYQIKAGESVESKKMLLIK